MTQKLYIIITVLVIFGIILGYLITKPIQKPRLAPTPPSSGALTTTDPVYLNKSQDYVKLKKLLPLNTDSYKLAFNFQNNKFELTLSEPYNTSLEIFSQWLQSQQLSNLVLGTDIIIKPTN